MAEFLPHDALVPAASPMEQAAILRLSEPPVVEAIAGEGCPGVSVQFPAGTIIRGEAGPEASDGIRFQLSNLVLDNTEALLVPAALRTLVRSIRLVPTAKQGTTLAFDLLENVDTRRMASPRPEVLMLALDAMSCSPPELAGERGLDAGEEEQILTSAEESIRAENYPKAIRELARILEAPHSPSTARARELSGIIAERTGSPDEARSIYQSFVDDYPGHDAVPRVKMRLGELERSNGRSPSDHRKTAEEGDASLPSDKDGWRTSLRGFFSQFYLLDRSRAAIFDDTGAFREGFIDTRVNVDELLSIADATFVATKGTTSIEARASAGHVSEFRPIQLTGADRNQGSYSLLDELSLSLTFGELGHRIAVGRQKEYGLGIFGRFDGIAASAALSSNFSIRAVVGSPVWSERQTSIERERGFYAIGLDFESSNDRLSGGIYWFDQRSAGERDRQAIGAHFRARNDTLQVDGLIDYDVAFNTLNTAYLRGTVALSQEATASLTGRIQHYPSLSLTNAILGQREPRLATILELESVSAVRQAARDRSLQSRSINLTLSLPIASDWRVISDSEISSLSGDPGSLGLPAYLATGTEYRTSVQAIASNLFRKRDTLVAAFSIANRDRFSSVSFDARYQLPLGSAAYISPRMRITRRVQKAGRGAQTTFYPSVRAVWKPAPKVELEAQIGRIHRDERYVNYDWSGTREERSFVAHIGYTLRF